MEEHRNWQCPKCGNTTFKTDMMRATGGRFAKIFDVQNRKFSTITCMRCTYTEFYRADTSTLGNILDFFTN